MPERGRIIKSLTCRRCDFKAYQREGCESTFDNWDQDGCLCPACKQARDKALENDAACLTGQIREMEPVEERSDDHEIFQKSDSSKRSYDPSKTLTEQYLEMMEEDYGKET